MYYGFTLGLGNMVNYEGGRRVTSQLKEDRSGRATVVTHDHTAHVL